MVKLGWPPRNGMSAAQIEVAQTCPAVKGGDEIPDFSNPTGDHDRSDDRT
jgi:hypothetical protein